MTQTSVVVESADLDVAEGGWRRRCDLSPVAPRTTCLIAPNSLRSRVAYDQRSGPTFLRRWTQLSVGRWRRRAA